MRKKDKVKVSKKPKKVKAPKVKKDTLAMRVLNTERQIAHLNKEIEEIKAQIVVSTDPARLAELGVVLADLERSLAEQIAKLASITGSTPPVVAPVPPPPAV